MVVPGQLSRKNCASSHEVICEQCVLPSQRYCAVATAAAGDGLEDGAYRSLMKKWYPNMAAQTASRITFFMI
ncbi:hypothetical protein DSECCO2_477330 [anaerobic digester metagenome]